MRKRSISDEDAAALLAGVTPENRPDLSPLAAALDDYRVASFGPPPQPSAELETLLGIRAPGISASPVAPPAKQPIHTAELAAERRATPRVRRSRMFLGWIAGLSLGAKIALGAVAATATVVGAGSADVLPAPAQTVFDDVVTVISPFDRADETRGDDGRGEAGREAGMLNHQEAQKRAEEAKNNAVVPEQGSSQVHVDGDVSVGVPSEAGKSGVDVKAKVVLRGGVDVLPEGEDE